MFANSLTAVPGLTVHPCLPVVDGVGLDVHINTLRDVMLETSPGNPPTSRDSSVDDLKERELLEQKVIAEFNQAVLRMKRDVLTEMRGNLL